MTIAEIQHLHQGKAPVRYDLARHVKIKIMFGFYGFIIAVLSLILSLIALVKGSGPW